MNSGKPTYAHPVQYSMCVTPRKFEGFFTETSMSRKQDSVSYHPTAHTHTCAHTEAFALCVFDIEYVGECNNIFWNVPKIHEMQTFLKLFCPAILR